MGVPGSTMGTIFTPVPSEMKSYKPESVAGEQLHLLIPTLENTIVY